jgi:hypothetical protein
MPESEGPQTFAVDRAAAGFGKYQITPVNKIQSFLTAGVGLYKVNERTVTQVDEMTKQGRPRT